MVVSEAIRRRISELLIEKEVTAYKLSFLAGISASIISDCKRGKVKEPTISSLIHICEGLDIELKDFFDSPYFNDVEAIDRFDKNKNKNKNKKRNTGKNTDNDIDKSTDQSENRDEDSYNDDVIDNNNDNNDKNDKNNKNKNEDKKEND